MTYEREYQNKLRRAEDVVQLIKSGDWVDYGWCCGHPVALDKALAARAVEEDLTDIKIRGGVCLWKPAVTELPDFAKRFTWNSWHMGGIERKLAATGGCFYTPLRYSELPRYYREHIVPADICMFQVCPMDKNGYFNIGPNASHLAAVCETSKIVVVEVNHTMPRCLGGAENELHITNVDYIVEGDNPPMGILGGVPATEVDQKVAERIMPLIPSGACLQLGIGGMPNAVGTMIAQSDLRDLGVHTEMYVDAFVDIAVAGKITGKHKSIDRGRQVYAFAAGSQRLYDYLDDNPEMMNTPVDYVNDVRTVAKLDNFISINNAVDVDLFGQVNSESAGPKHISGAGGQLDFVLGAYLSKGGKSIICCSSTYTTKEGELKSRIRPMLTPGSIVTDTRPNVHYFVTEYGLVCLKGLSTWERADALISCAHPNFREELIRAAGEMKIWRESNKR